MQKIAKRFCGWKILSKHWLVWGILPTVSVAQSYKTLSDKVLLQTGDTNAASIVKSLQQQTKYIFIYDPEYLKKIKVTASHFNSNSIADVLYYLDENTPLDIELTDANTISLRTGRQVKDGKVTGKIVDSRNEPLPGVTIKADGSKGTVSKVDGTYELSLSPGTYTLTYSYISFESRKVTEVKIHENENTPLNILLARAANSQLREVTVTANYRKASVQGLYALQKNNAAVTDGISAEQISRTPDKNIGEVLKRVSGLATMENKYVIVRGLGERYNQSLLDGQVMPSTELNRKNFSYDIIPSNIVENVTVIKTLTPDHSAEFGGGLVEVNTLSVPTSNFFNITVGGSVNNQTTGKDFVSLKLEGKEYLGQVSSHRNFMGKLNWGSITEALDAYGKGGTLSSNWGLYKFKAQPSQNYQLSIGHIFPVKNGGQFGAIASVSYRNTLAVQDIRMTRNGYDGGLDDPKAGFLGYTGKRYGFTTNLGGLIGIGYKDKRNMVSYQSMYLRTLEQQLLIGMYQQEFGYFDLTTQTSLFTNQLKGEHTLGNKGIKLKWMGSYLHLDREKPDNHFESSFAIKDSTQVNNYNIRNAAFPSSSYGALRSWNRALEKDINWDVSLSVPFAFFNTNNTLKAGFAGWSKDRLFYVLNMGTSFSNDGQNYLPLATAFTAENGVDFKPSHYGDNSHRTASLMAPYIMLDDKIGKFRLVWGVRAEYYNLNKVNEALENVFAMINRDRPNAEKYDFSLIKNQEPNLRFFPSANLTYSLTPAMNIRLAYSQSIIRPDLRELNYFQEYDFELGGNYTAGYVRSSPIRNLDIRYEWYPGAGEVMSLSVFQKDIKYPMEIYKDGTNNSYTLTNNKSAKNVGVEIEMRKSLAFTKIPVISNITLYANGTLLSAHVKPLTLDYNGVDPGNPLLIVPREQVGPSQRRPQTGASNYMANAGIYYDTKPVSLSLVYNYVSNRLFRPSADYSQSLFERPLTALDGQIAVRVLKQKGEIKFNVANLLDSYQVVYFNIYGDGLTRIDNPSTKELLYQAGKDKIDYEARPGRTYSMSFSYKF
ncbi:Outer membrane receptor proteins, mostly Fe transport [Chitinophaga sp. YR573]|uniref:TonB-dependent receptor n=1 Tax=Chitinophaga sp. YR573 TaxID=1881040 RepID=UPI0008D324FE|nr:TonB-dependent receptor [Chitinophaga sp. YR573]SEW44277.1 Outer membrane receptor proteins, mostly Fe transport [Chitinophaga sp. YR573]